MRLPDFAKLPQTLQLENLRKNGAYIGKRKCEGQSVLLFQYESFYVEIYYRTYRKEVDRIMLSDSLSILDLYWDQINSVTENLLN
jgi:hypothetical protein